MNVRKRVIPMVTHIHAKHFDSYYERFTELVCGSKLSERWEQTISLPATLGEGTIRRMRIRPGMEIVTTDIKLEQDMKRQFRGSYSLFELNYCLSGDIFCAWMAKNGIRGIVAAMFAI